MSPCFRRIPEYALAHMCLHVYLLYIKKDEAGGGLHVGALITIINVGVILVVMCVTANTCVYLNTHCCSWALHEVTSTSVQSTYVLVAS